MRRRSVTTRATVQALAASLALVPSALAQLTSDQVPRVLEGVGIIDRRGEQIPLDVEFKDEEGRTVTLGRYFEGDRPVILTLNYYRCPMLCTLVLNGMVDGLNGLDWSAGEEFQIVTLSFNHEEGPELAKVKKRAYLTLYQREAAAEGWHFLTGSEENIRRLTDAVGFGFRYNEKNGEYAHPSTLTFLTPDGRISLYMDNTVFDSKDLRLALVEASRGAIGSALDRIALLLCFQYDPDSNSYVVVAWKVMRAFALVTMTVLIGGLGLLWYRDMSRSHHPNGRES